MIIRLATNEDRQGLANLIHYEVYVHRHLDWRPPIDWVGRQPCLVAERNKHLHAALICPPDPPEVAWIRLFVASQEAALEETWNILWVNALNQLNALACPPVAAIALRPWFQSILEQNGFEQIQEIISLVWEGGKRATMLSPSGVDIRPMNDSDLPPVHTLDTAAFGPLCAFLEQCYQCYVRRAVERNNELIGYRSAQPVRWASFASLLCPAYQEVNWFRSVYEVFTKFDKQGVMSGYKHPEDNLTIICV
jgi:hypothetical protein